MQRIRLAGVTAAVLVALLAGTAVIAQQAGSSRNGGDPTQATPGGDPTRSERPQRPGRWYDSDADDRDGDLRLFEDYAGDDGMQRGQGRGDGYEGRDRGGPDRWAQGFGAQRGSGDDPRGQPGGMAGRGMGRGFCGPRGSQRMERMVMRLERITSPNEAQRAAFEKLKDAVARAREVAQAGCPTERAVTPPGRLAAAEKRLEAMLGAVRIVRPALEEYFGLLTEEQKARLYAAAERMRMHARWRAWHEQRHGGWDGGRGGYGRGERSGRGYDDDGDRRGGWRGGRGYGDEGGRGGYGRGERGGRGSRDDDGERRGERRRGPSDDDRDGWPDRWRGRS